MKKTLLTLLGLVALNAGAMDYSGTYTCTGKDKIDGYLKPSSFKMIKNSQNSYPERDQYSYDVKDDAYPAYAISVNNNIAMYFASSDPQSPNDKGVAIISATIDPDGNVTFNKRYYEPTYSGNGYASGDGYETCVRTALN